MKMANGSEIETCVRAVYPLLYVVSHEEQRVIKKIAEIGNNLNKEVQVWSMTDGFKPVVASDDGEVKEGTQSSDAENSMLNIIQNDSVTDTIYVLLDFHAFLSKEDKVPAVVRYLRDSIKKLPTRRCSIIILSPLLEIPPELAREIHVIDYPLPLEKDIRRYIKDFQESYEKDNRIKIIMDRAAADGAKMSKKEAEKIFTEGMPGQKFAPKVVSDNLLTMTDETIAQVVQALAGLTEFQIMNVLCKSLIETGGFDIRVINKEKEQTIRKSGTLELVTIFEDMSNVGGLKKLKEYMAKRAKTFSKSAIEYGLPFPKGFLLWGQPGTGKSLCAKATASTFRANLLSLSPDRIKAKYVGESEQKMAEALKAAKASAPCILWIDEVDKVFPNCDTFTSEVAGDLTQMVLKFMQENTDPIIFLFTTNEPDKINPALLRPGRLDSIWEVGLPNLEARKEIYKIHISKVRRISEHKVMARDPSNFDIDQLATASDKYSGAEIEASVVNAMFDAYDDNGREYTTDDILKALKEITPQSKIFAKVFEAQAQILKGRSRNANEDDKPVEHKDKARVIDL
jgi:ATP-dependent 26S proteasome regulatory subunit